MTSEVDRFSAYSNSDIPTLIPSSLFFEGNPSNLDLAVMGELDVGIVLPIITQYPEMDPDAPESAPDGSR